MHKAIDARQLACPGPVLQVKEALEAGPVTTMEVIVDNQAARENVSRFLQSRGFSVETSTNDQDFFVSAKRSAATEGVAPVVAAHRGSATESSAARKIMVVIAADAMGRGDQVLGAKLLINYLKTLKEMGPELWRLVFINGGVTLTVTGSPVLDELRTYEQNGLIIMACGTCLEHFGLTADKQVGQTTNMLDIVTAMQLADSVITIG